MMNECNGTREHRYEARFDEKPRDLEGGVDGPAMQIRELLVLRIYIGDRCTRCGDWKPREVAP